MSTIEAVRIRNFKAYGDQTQIVPIRRITLIFGRNSSGKSSLVHGLLAVGQSWLPDADLPVFRAKGPFVDCGTLDNCLHASDGQRADALAVGVDLPGRSMMFEWGQEPGGLFSVAVTEGEDSWSLQQNSDDGGASRKNWWLEADADFWSSKRCHAVSPRAVMALAGETPRGRSEEAGPGVPGRRRCAGAERGRGGLIQSDPLWATTSP